jgi:hypothetical protein
MFILKDCIAVADPLYCQSFFLLFLLLIYHKDLHETRSHRH